MSRVKQTEQHRTLSRGLSFLSLGSILCAFAAQLAANAQNLVPNSSFEEYSACPDAGGQIHLAVGWHAFRGSPDYFNACDPGLMSVPLNWVANRAAADGVGYAGVLAWTQNVPNEREHLGSALIYPLEPLVPVNISFRVMAATNGTQQNHKWTSNGIGVRFTTQPYMQFSTDPLPDQAAVLLDEAPVDTVEWTLVQGVYIPDSNYTHIAIGGFLSDSLLSPVLFNPDGTVDRSYMLLDDICVSIDSNTCDQVDGWHSTLKATPAELTIAPNPFVDQLIIKSNDPNNQIQSLEVLDQSGRVVPVNSSNNTGAIWRIDTQGISNGTFILKALTKKGAARPHKIVRLSP